MVVASNNVGIRPYSADIIWGRQVMKCNQTLFYIFYFLLMTPITGLATDYHIGPSQKYTSIGAAPWSSIGAGDRVYIHAKASQVPYYEHLYISAALQGTQQNPIQIIGVNDSSGNQPILDGTNSTTGTHFDTYASSQYHSQLGIVVFGPGGSSGYKSASQWVTLSNIKVQNYRNVSTTDEAGATAKNVSGACIYLQGGQHITLDRLTITGCADGLFGKDDVSPVKYIILQNSYIYGNGVPGDYLYHNTYTEVKYLTMQYNHFGPPISGSLGNNIKDRSAGLVVRYNGVSGGQHLIDIVECQDNCADHTSDSAWNDSFVYGNIFYAGPGDAGQLFHLGTGDSGAATSVWRKNLYFYDNTIDYKRNQNDEYYMNIFQLSGSQQTVYLNNNIFYAEPATSGQPVSEVYLQFDESETPSASGNMVIGKNWFSPGWLLTKKGVSVTGKVTGMFNIISPIGNNPYFTNASTQDYHLLSNSAAIGSAGALPALISTGNWTGTDLTPVYEYVAPQSSETRSSISDLGAYKFGPVVSKPN